MDASDPAGGPIASWPEWGFCAPCRRLVLTGADGELVDHHHPVHGRSAVCDGAGQPPWAMPDEWTLAGVPRPVDPRLRKSGAGG